MKGSRACFLLKRSSTSIALCPQEAIPKACRRLQRTDMGVGDIAPERLGQDFFPYRPAHLRREPPMPSLAHLTNVVQQALATGQYAGAIWLEGSPFVEETSYWLNLLIDTPVVIVGNASQRAHGAVSNDGDRNIIDAVDYIFRVSGRTTTAATRLVSWSFRTSRCSQLARSRKLTPARGLRGHRRAWRHRGDHGAAWPPDVNFQAGKAAYVYFGRQPQSPPGDCGGDARDQWEAHQSHCAD